VTAWALEGDFDPSQVRSNAFAIEWPRGSGEQREFPEIDRVAWFDVAVARRKLVKGQAALLEALERRLGGT
jgi:predicted NUDIX family NTP pyrophosphohydrolase